MCTREEFQLFTRQMMELLHNFLQFFVSYGMAMGKGQQDADIQALNQQLESFLGTDEETKELLVQFFTSALINSYEFFIIPNTIELCSRT